MRTAQAEITLELTPRSRLDIIDVRQRIAEEHNGFLSEFPKALYYSYHTTAGYLEQSLCERLNFNPEKVEAFIRSFQKLFPPDADYRHDQMHLRTELSEAQRGEEPRNADSHLTYIGSGLTNCVTYSNRPDRPVYFIDLDGVCSETHRRRRTTVVGFNQEVPVGEAELQIPVSSHSVDSINLKDPRLGFFDQLHELIRRHSIQTGRVDVSLAPTERHTGLTVNEYETLLMKHDLVEVLCDPLRFMYEKGRHILENPRAVPSKAMNYARYDLVQVVNEFLDVLGLNESRVERVIEKFLGVPASRFLRMKRSVSLLISDNGGNGCGKIVQGTYQSPILVQWRKSATKTRRFRVSFFRFC